MENLKFKVRFMSEKQVPYEITIRTCPVKEKSDVREISKRSLEFFIGLNGYTLY